MKKIKVIKRSSLPVKLPISNTVLYTFLLHYFNAPEWLWTLFIVLYSIYWILCIIGLFLSESVDVFK